MLKLINRLFRVFWLGLLWCLRSQSTYGGEVSTIQHPEWSKNVTIYEVNIRQYTPAGTFKAFEAQLPRLKEMGVGILWIMPIHPIGEKERKGTLGSYYAVKDYQAVNPEFGTADDFRHLVQRCHELGMYVIIDWVANHTAWDHDWTVSHPDFYSRDGQGNFYPPVDGWQDVIDLNYDNPQLREAMTRALEYWVREYDIDGYRCDVAAMVPIEFWNEARTRLDKIKPVFMLAEAHEPLMHIHAFDLTYGWQFKGIFVDIVQGKKTVSDLNRYLEQEERVVYPPDAYRMLFTSNHDENSWNGTEYELLGEAANTFAALSCLLKGMPLVYSGQEAGLDKRLPFFEKDSILWQDHPRQAIYRTLFNLKKDNKALWNGLSGGEPQRLKTSQDKTVFAFRREKENDKVVAIFNLAATDVSAKIDVPGLAGQYLDVFTGQMITLSSSNAVTLPKWGYQVLVKK